MISSRFLFLRALRGKQQNDSLLIVVFILILFVSTYKFKNYNQENFYIQI